MKHLLFDFDGVIVDSFRVAFETMNSFKQDQISEAEYRAYFNGNIYDTQEVDELMHQNQQDNILDENDPFFKKYVPLLLELGPVIGMSETISELAKTHSMSIISSTISAPIERYLKKYEIDVFDNVYGGDVDKNKMRKIARYLEANNIEPSEALFITDTLGDIREAEAVGVKALAVSWGYQDAQTLKIGQPLKIVESPRELLEIIIAL